MTETELSLLLPLGPRFTHPLYRPLDRWNKEFDMMLWEAIERVGWANIDAVTCVNIKRAEVSRN